MTILRQAVVANPSLPSHCVLPGAGGELCYGLTDATHLSWIPLDLVLQKSLPETILFP